jgi:hypothetical protein
VNFFPSTTGWLMVTHPLQMTSYKGPMQLQPEITLEKYKEWQEIKKKNRDKIEKVH